MLWLPLELLRTGEEVDGLLLLEGLELRTLGVELGLLLAGLELRTLGAEEEGLLLL